MNSTKEGRIKVLVWLSNFHDSKKFFKELTKQEILEFLNNLRKPIAEDPTQRWIGSYNGRQIILSKALTVTLVYASLCTMPKTNTDTLRIQKTSF